MNYEELDDFQLCEVVEKYRREYKTCRNIYRQRMFDRTIGKLPIDIRRDILGRLNNRDYANTVKTGKFFNVATPTQIQRRRNMTEIMHAVEDNIVKVYFRSVEDLQLMLIPKTSNHFGRIKEITTKDYTGEIYMRWYKSDSDYVIEIIATNPKCWCAPLYFSRYEVDIESIIRNMNVVLDNGMSVYNSENSLIVGDAKRSSIL